MRAWGQFATVWILALWSAPALAIAINDYTAGGNNRFASGYPSGPVVPNTDPSFIGLGYDWSGVGWVQTDPDTSLALLTPRQLLMANHYKQSGTIQFVSASGQATNAFVQYGNWQNAGAPTDLGTATLTTPLPQSASIQPYSILFQGYNPNTYVGYNLLSYGWTAEIGWNKIASVNTGTYYFNYPGSPFAPDSSYYMNYLYDTSTPDRTQLISGDSGSPSFIVTGSPGVMYLAGAHYATAAGYAGWDSFLPLSLPSLDSDTAPTGYLPSVVTPVTARWTSASSSSGTWGANSNWSNGTVPNDVLTSGQVTTCASVLFDGLAGPQHSITLSGAQAVTSLAFNLTPSTTSGFTFSGASLTLGEAGLTNNDIHTQTFNNAIVLRTSQEWHAGAGGLTISASGSLDLGTRQLLYLDGSGTSDFEGVVSGSGSSIAKDGSGTFILGNANNSFSGQIFIHNGTLQFASIQNVGGGNSALGAPTTVANGTIYLAGTLAYVGSGSSSNRLIDVADGPGAAGSTTGVIDASGAGALTLTGGVTCDINSDGYTPITGTSTLVLQGSGSGSQSGIISSNISSSGSNVMSLVKTGGGTWSLSAANTYNGTTAVNGGLLTLSGSGGIAQSTALTVSGGTVQLNDSAAASNFSSSRLGNQPITLQGGVLQLNVGNVSGGTETIGPVTAAVGENTLALATSAGNGILSAGTLTRMPGATLNFTGSLSGSNGMAFSGMSSGSNFMGAGAFVNGADYAVYDAGGFVRAMVTGTNAWDYATSVTSSRDVRLTTAVASQPSVTLQTLSLSGSSAGFSLAGNETLTLSAGGILKTGGGTATIGGGAGLFTTGEYVLRADTPGDQLRIATPLGGGTGLTKSGLGTLVLGAAGSSYGGTTTIAAGTLQTTVAGAIPSTSPLVIANAASLDLAGQAQTVAGITLYDGAVQNSGAATALTLGGIGAGVAYAGVGNGSSISAGALNLASIGSVSSAHFFSVARGQGSVDLNILAGIADGSSSSQSLVKTGSGILQLSGTNSFTGGTQIQAGALVLGSNYAIPAASSLTLSVGTLNLGGYANTAASLVMQNGLISGNGSFSAASVNLQAGTLAGSLVGTGSLSKTTSGVVTITSSNNYSGGTTLSGGTLMVSADNNLGATAGALALDGATLQVLGTSFTSTTRLVTTTSNGGTISVADPNNTLTLATQNLAGSGALTKAGQGGLQLGGSIGSTAITVQDGILQLTGSAGQLTANPALSLWNVASFSFSNHNESVSTINLTGGTINTGTGTLNLAGSLNYAQSIWPATIEGNLSLGTAAGAFSVNLGASIGLTVAANISGSPAGGLVKTGNGLLLLSGADSYTGVTTISGGALQANSGAGLPGSSNLTLNGGVLQSNGAATFTRLLNSSSTDVQWTSLGGGFSAGGGTLTIDLGGNGSGTGGPITWGTTVGTNIVGTLMFGSLSAAGETDFLNPIDFHGASRTIQVTAGQGGDFAQVAGALSNSTGTAGLIKTGNGMLALAGSNTYNGTTTVNAGTLLATTTASLPGYSTSGMVSVAGGAVLAARTGDGTTGWSSGQIDSLWNHATWADPTAALGIDTTNGNFTYGGNLTQALGLTKLGANTLTLTGTNTYTGVTNVNAGTLLATTIASLPGYNSYLTGSGAINVAGGAVLAVQTGNGTTGWSSDQIDSLWYSANFVAPTALLGIDTTNGNFTYASNIIQPFSLAKLGANTLTLTGSNTYTGATTVNAGTLLATTTASLPGYSTPGMVSVAGGAVLAVQTGSGTSGWSSGQIDSLWNNATWAGKTAVLGIDTTNGNFTYASNITQALGLAKLGTNTLFLTGSNTYSGGTTITAGTLAVASSANLGTGGLTFSGSGAGLLDIIGSTAFTSNSTVTLSQNGTIQQDDSAGAALSGPISGPGSLTKTGSGWLGLSGTNTYTGGTTVSSGTLQILSSGAFPGGGLIIATDGALILDSDSPLQSLATEGGLAISPPGGSSDPALSLISALSTPVVPAVTPQLALNSVPEPGTLVLLLAAGGGGLLWHVRRRRPNSSRKGR